MMMRSPSDYGMHNEVDPRPDVWPNGAPGRTDGVAGFAHEIPARDRLFGHILSRAVDNAYKVLRCKVFYGVSSICGRTEWACQKK